MLISKHSKETRAESFRTRWGCFSGKESADTFIAQNRQDLADEELAQVKVIEEYLPKPLSADEIEGIVKGIIEQTGASSMKDMGKVMGMASKQMAGKADGKVISDIVKKLLA